MAQPTDKRKQSLYFPEETLLQIQQEANRQDRSLSWIVQQAWRTARARIAQMPGVADLRSPPNMEFAQAMSQLRRAARKGDRSRDPSADLRLLLERAELLATRI